jgi:hypothetical protein
MTAESKTDFIRKNLSIAMMIVAFWVAPGFAAEPPFNVDAKSTPSMRASLKHSVDHSSISTSSKVEGELTLFEAFAQVNIEWAAV